VTKPAIRSQADLFIIPAPNRRGHLAMLLSDVSLSVCLSVAYIGPKSRTERPRKTKIGTEIAHVTCDVGYLCANFLGHHFQGSQKVKVTRPLYSARP